MTACHDAPLPPLIESRDRVGAQEIIVICPHCGSHRNTFNGELAIHFSGLAGLQKPIVWVFPSLRVCLSCVAGEFVVPERERQVLITGRDIPGAIVSESRAE